MGDLQVFLGLGPGFGQQPDAGPEASPEQQTPEPADAVADDADGARRTAARVPVIGSQRFGRRPQVAWSNPALIGVFHPGAAGQGQQGAHRQHQPVAGDAVGPVRRVLSHFQPRLLTALKPSSVQKRRAYQLIPAPSGGRPVRMIQGSSGPAYQTASRVQRRWAVGGPKAVPWPAQAVPGTETRARACNRLPPSAQQVMFFRYRV